MTLFQKFDIWMGRPTSDMQEDLQTIEKIITSATLLSTHRLTGHNYHSGGCERTVSVWESGNIILVGDILSPDRCNIVEGKQHEPCNYVGYGGDFSYGVEVSEDGSVREYKDSKQFDGSDIETTYL